ATPRELAAIASPVALLASSEHTPGLAQRLYESATMWLGERATIAVAKVQGVAEATGASKIAAITASSAAIAGGGVAAIDAREEPDRDRRPQRAAVSETRHQDGLSPPAVVAPAPTPEPAAASPAPEPTSDRGGDSARRADERSPREASLADTSASRPAEPPSEEFLPAGTPQPVTGGGGSGGGGKATSPEPEDGGSKSPDGGEFSP
ncbi:MAG: hypothetical protein H0U42_09335, partial [Thermoleophilaceae bacterium]|nr:hypothetical protein [Thermoleophilaceae bacterium]